MVKLLFLFFLFIPVVFAIYGGENITVDYDDFSYGCNDKVAVYVSKDTSFKYDEYEIVNCNKTGNFWECNCTGEFTLATKFYAYGNYTFRIESDKPAPSTSNSGGSSSGGGGGGGGWSGTYYKKPTNTTSGTVTKTGSIKKPRDNPKSSDDTSTNTNTDNNNDNIEIGNTTTLDPNNIEQTSSGTSYTWLWVLVILIIIGGLAQGVYYLFFANN